MLKAGQQYKHFKGGEYEIVSVAKDCENPDTEFVVYRSLKYGTTWIREKGNFLESVERENYSGPRFIAVE